MDATVAQHQPALDEVPKMALRHLSGLLNRITSLNPISRPDREKLAAMLGETFDFVVGTDQLLERDKVEILGLLAALRRIVEGADFDLSTQVMTSQISELSLRLYKVAEGAPADATDEAGRPVRDRLRELAGRFALFIMASPSAGALAELGAEATKHITGAH